MKVLNKEDMIKKNKVKRVMTEREILAASQHPFIVTLHWCWVSARARVRGRSCTCSVFTIMRIAAIGAKHLLCDGL